MSMNHLEEIVDYAKDCIAHPETNCKKHRWACERLLRDVDKLLNCSEFPYYWDDDKADQIIQWFAMLRHSKGVLAGKPIDLTLWQRFRLCQLYGWRRKEDDRRRFRKSFTEVGRKNAKSQEEAGVALFEISVTATENGEVAETYTAGTKRDQSKIVFNEAGLMLEDPLCGPGSKLTKPRSST